MAASPHERPIRLVVRDDSLERSRLTVFFRLILAIPLLIWLVVWGIGAFAVAFVLWLAVLINREAPRNLHDFVAAYLRFSTHFGAYIFLAVQIFRNGGEQQGFDWLKKYDQNVLQYTPTCPAPITLVARGEAVVGMTWQDDATEAMLGKQPIEVIFPPETGAEIGGASIIKGGPNPDGAKKFVDFLLSTKGRFSFELHHDAVLCFDRTIKPEEMPPLMGLTVAFTQQLPAVALQWRSTRLEHHESRCREARTRFSALVLAATPDRL